MPDVKVYREGLTLFLFRPLTARARRWLFENVQPGAQWFAGRLAVEPRYAEALALALQDEGFRVS